MSDTAKRFIEKWIDDNIHAEGYQPEGDNSEARQQAERCQAAGLREAHTVAELDAAAADTFGGGDCLVDLMATAIEDANDRVQGRPLAEDE